MQDIFSGLRGCSCLPLLVFLVVRHYVVPKSFGQYGHYRGAAIGEIAAHPAKFAGHETCEGCHSDVQDQKMKGAHAHVNCEACHGALIQRLPALRSLRRTSTGDCLLWFLIPPMPVSTPTMRTIRDPVIPARYGGALRALPHGQRGQAQGLSAGGSG
jgi:hypothetical protein